MICTNLRNEVCLCLQSWSWPSPSAPSCAPSWCKANITGTLTFFCKLRAQYVPWGSKCDLRVKLMHSAYPQEIRVIPLSPARNNALYKLINDGLARGKFRRTTSPRATPVFFTSKEDNNLWLWFDYQQFNRITMKDKYPLPLTMELVYGLLDTNTYTKLEICTAIMVDWLVRVQGFHWYKGLHFASKACISGIIWPWRSPWTHPLDVKCEALY